MVATKKRPAESSTDGDVKKVKLEKNSQFKRNDGHRPDAKSSPFKRNDGQRPDGRKPFGKPAGAGAKPWQKNSSNNKFSKGKGQPHLGPSAKFGAGGGGGRPIKQEKNDKEQTSTEKTDWTKFKKEKKELKLQRKTKSNKDYYEMTNQAKQIYESLKCKSTPDKDGLCRQLHTLLRGAENYQKLVMAHDTARIVQCMLKHSPAEIRREVSESLIPMVGKMVISKYAHFCVSRMIKYGTPDIKQKVIEAIFGNVLKLLSHEHSASIIDTIYISWANTSQKAFMRQELYGDLYKTSKDSNVKCIADTYKDSTHMKLGILNAVKANLERVANKKLVDNSLIHAVLLDYLNESNEQDRGEIVTTYSPYIPSLASTKDGVRAAMICFWNSIVKDRRAIVKTIREHLVKLCTHEHGHILILAIVNSMDDTKALKKAIFDAIFVEITTVMASPWGRRVIEWFVSPANTASFHPQMSALLEEGLKFSKKDKEMRRAELLEAVQEPLCNAIAENPEFWLRGGNTALATASILQPFTGEQLRKAFDALATVVCNVDWQVPLKEPEEEPIDDADKPIKVEKIEGETEASAKPAPKPRKKKVFVGNEPSVPAVAKEVELVTGVEHAGLHIALKKILKLGKDVADSTKFSSSLAANLNDAVMDKWLPLNRACFLLLNAYENADADTQETLKAIIAGKSAALKKQKHAASKLLLKNLNIK